MIRSHPLAILLTDGANGWPLATHIPTLPDLESAGGGLVGGAIFGHLNRGNPHWQHIRRGGPAMLIYQGPHGYVSPAVYQTTPAAPTWDFTAVHVRGSVAPIPGGAQTLEVITRTVASYERELGTGWDMTASLGYFDRLLPGVGAFRLTVEEFDSMFKLSQEQTAEVRERTRAAFERRPEHRRLAELIGRVG